MKNQFFVSCLESRIEEETSWYSKFELGPFIPGQALTVANSLRRTLLSQQKGIFVLAVEIQGAIHEYSRLEGVKESILDILLNFRQISLILKNESAENENFETILGYFDIQGPGEVKAGDLKFPKKFECINPNQKIATLNRNGHFQGRILITTKSNLVVKNNSIGDPLKFSLEALKQESLGKLSNTNWLYINPILNPIQRVNYIIQQSMDISLQKEIVILELWTNGTIHPKQAIQTACFELANLFSGLSSFNELSSKPLTNLNLFQQIKTEITTSGNDDLVHNEFESQSKGVSILTPKEQLSERISTILDLDISNLNLSLQSYLIFKKANIDNIGNLLQYKKADLLQLNNFSEKRLTEVLEALHVFGLSLN